MDLSVGEKNMRSASSDRDDVVLLDLWILLVERKRILLATCAAFVVLGIAWVVLIPERYSFKSSLEIANVTRDKQSSPIEDPAAVLVKVTEGYLPLARNAFSEEHPGEKPCVVAARIPRSGNILVLESIADVERSAGCIVLHNSVMKSVLDDHRRLSENLRKGYETQLQQIKSAIAGYDDERKILLARKARANDLDKLVSEQIEARTRLVATELENRKRAASGIKDTSQAITLLLIDQQIEQNQARLAELEERKVVELKEERDDLDKKLAGLARERKHQEMEFDRINAEFGNMRESAVLVPPARSLEPIFPDRWARIWLTAMLGLVAGVLAALIASFLAAAKGRRRERESS